MALESSGTSGTSGWLDVRGMDVGLGSVLRVGLNSGLPW